MMTDQQYVSLVAQGGTPVRLADQRGAPYPTTGSGALVFANGATLTSATLENATFTGDLVFAQSVPNITSLKSLTNRPSWVTTEGYFAAGDGGGGPPWLWVEGSTATADDFMVVRPNSGVAGRYVRQLQTGAAVSPKWAGCGFGSTDDTTRFQVVVDYGLPVDISGGTFPVRNIAISTTTCPGIFSDGSGTMTAGAGATSSTNIFIVSKSDFYVDRVKFSLPVSTSPTVRPDASSGIRHTGLTGSRLRVTNCYHRGGGSFCYFDGQVDQVLITDNIIEETWSDAIDVDSGVDILIDRNVISGGGYSTSAASGAIRTGPTGAGTRPTRNLKIRANIIKNFALHGQSAIDCYASGARNIEIAGNLVDNCGAGIELKVDASVVSPDEYQNILVTGNFIDCSLLATNYVAIALNSTTSALPVGKAGRAFITGNKINGDGLSAAADTFYGITADAYFDTTISGNDIRGTSRGIAVSPANSGNLAGLVISGNVVRTVGLGIQLSGTGSTFVSPSIVNNDVVVESQRALVIANAATTDISVKGNTCRSLTGPAVELRNITGGLVTQNTFKGDASQALLGQSVAIADIEILDNDLISGTTAPVNLGIGTGISVVGNRIRGPSNERGVTGAATYTTANNQRGTASVIPTGAGAIGDVYMAAPATSGSFFGWVCTTAGGTGVAVWKGYAAIS